MKNSVRFVVVDDDSLSNCVWEVAIKAFEPTAHLKIFNDPEAALISVLESYGESSSPVYMKLFLNIDMPLAGWDFVENFRTFVETLGGQFRMYVLTSSVTDYTTKIKEYPFIEGLLHKPLSAAVLKRIAGC